MNSDDIEGTIKNYAGAAETKLGNALGNTKMSVNGVVDSAKGKAQEVYGKAQDAYGKAQDAYGKVRDKAQELADDAPEYVDRAKEAGRRAAQTGRDYAAKANETVKTQVQEQPVATLLGGVAVGFLLGWLINSRRS
jgi:uncharacterized protein YjbJ (UPF0337 family)